MLKLKSRAGEMDFKVEGPRNIEKKMSATMVGGQENFFNSRRSRMAKTLLGGKTVA